MNANLFAALKGANASGVLAGGYPFAKNIWYTGDDTPTFAKRVDTIQNMVDNMESNDVGFLAPGEYDEAVVCPDGLSGVVLFGMGNRGDVAIVPSAANATCFKVVGTAASRSKNVRLVNVGLETNGTGIAFHALGNIRRVTLDDCKIEGGDAAIKLESSAAGSVGDTRITNCELAWTVTALLLSASGGGDPVTQTRVLRNLLHNYSSRGIHVDTTFSADLWVMKNQFARQEDGTEPTNEYLLAAVASTSGVMAGNSFPAAAASGKISVAAATFIKGGNSYSDGWAA